MPIRASPARAQLPVAPCPSFQCGPRPPMPCTRVSTRRACPHVPKGECLLASFTYLVSCVHGVYTSCGFFYRGGYADTILARQQVLVEEHWIVAARNRIHSRRTVPVGPCSASSLPHSTDTYLVKEASLGSRGRNRDPSAREREAVGTYMQKCGTAQGGRPTRR